MTDRYKLNLFEAEKSFTYQHLHLKEFTSEALLTDKLHISTLSMDLPGISMKDRNKIEYEWLEILPSLDNIKSLSIRHKVDQEFFEAICKMKSLESLFFWTSSVENISSLVKLPKLRRLTLDSFSLLTDISVLSGLHSILILSIQNCFKINNYAILGDMSQLVGLQISGNSFAPKNLRLNSLIPLKCLKNLRHLDLSNTSVIDNSYEIILEMTNLERFDVTVKIPGAIREKVMTNHKTLQAGMFTDWDFDNNKLREGKQW